MCTFYHVGNIEGSLASRDIIAGRGEEHLLTITSFPRANGMFH